jgi:hypothetical protein
MEASKAKQDEAPESGELLFFGSSSWETVGKKSGAGDAGATYLSTPCRLAPLVGVPIVFVAGGSGKAALAIRKCDYIILVDCFPRATPPCASC